ncbi:MAG: choice-of-anchor L domain-containing protein [Bacteroidales bacterium]|nr:choice-of-anchor L domain-containing protein [Bacteroidales bacterium]
MKNIIYMSVLMFLFVTGNVSTAQVQIISGLPASALADTLCGIAVSFSNATLMGADVAFGAFSGGGTTNLGINDGIVLCSGSVEIIPGPNNTGSAGFNNGMNGDPDLTVLATMPTYDAVILEFDVIPVYDTLRFRYIFGSEEYPEWVINLFNDVIAIFVTGPDPSGGNYMLKNIALVPGTDLPVNIHNINNVIPSYPEYYVDNTGGQTIQYDGFTTPLPAVLPVVPGETYHIKIGVADAGDGIYDSGIFLKKGTLSSAGPPVFEAFAFLKEINPQLPDDITGVIVDSAVILTVPAGTDVTALVASYTTPAGVEVTSGGIPQQSGITPNDFSAPVDYMLLGCDCMKWTVHVTIMTGSPAHDLSDFSIVADPSDRSIILRNAKDCKAVIYNLLGEAVRTVHNSGGGETVIFRDMLPGIYIISVSDGTHTCSGKISLN